MRVDLTESATWVEFKQTYFSKGVRVIIILFSPYLLLPREKYGKRGFHPFAGAVHAHASCLLGKDPNYLFKAH